MKLPLHALAAVTFATVVLLSCDDPASEGEPTNAVCPTASSLTYANFGMAFFNSYCQRCHGSTVTGAARNNAPADHTFDTVEQIRALADHIDELAAAGPDATNVEMPPTAPTPSMTERMQLGEWLACNAP